MPTSKLSVKTTEGFVAKGARHSLESTQFELQHLGPWDIHVAISHCGICHSDLHLINNDWDLTPYPLVPGHEVVGTVVEKGGLVTEFQIGDRVGIGWQGSSCGQCNWCHQGEENLCLVQEATCVGHPGGFAKDIIADSRFSFLIPKSLSSESAAPLLCGGITVFSPFIQHSIQATWQVGIIGIGGLGHLAIQFAKAFGCEVVAFSSSPHKESEAKAFGADSFVSSIESQEIKKWDNHFDFLLCTSSNQLDTKLFMSILKPKGKLCFVGAPGKGEVDVGVFDLILGRKTICGSNIGSPETIRTMLAFAARHQISPKTELFAMSQVNEALSKLTKNQIHYRAVLYN